MHQGHGTPPVMTNGLFIYFILSATWKNNNQPVHIFPGNAFGDMAMCPEHCASRCGNVIWDVVAVGWFLIFPQHKKQLSCASTQASGMLQCIQGVAMLLMLVAAGRFFYFIFPTTLKNNNQPVRILFGRTWQSLTWDMDAEFATGCFLFMFYYMAGRLSFILFFLQHSKITINLLVSFPAGTWQSPASGSIVWIFENNQPAGGGVVAMWQKNCGFGSNVHHWKLCGARGNASGMWCSPVWWQTGCLFILFFPQHKK